MKRKYPTHLVKAGTEAETALQAWCVDLPISPQLVDSLRVLAAIGVSHPKDVMEAVIAMREQLEVVNRQDVPEEMKQFLLQRMQEARKEFRGGARTIPRLLRAVSVVATSGFVTFLLTVSPALIVPALIPGVGLYYMGDKCLESLRKAEEDANWIISYSQFADRPETVASTNDPAAAAE